MCLKSSGTSITIEVLQQLNVDFHEYSLILELSYSNLITAYSKQEI